MHTPDQAPEDFEDIKIVRADVDAAISVGDLWRIPLTLSDMPSNEWAERFEAEERAQWSSTRQRAVLDGQRIMATCRTEELQAEIDDLNPIVAATNRAYRDICTARQKELRKEQQAQSQSAAAKEKLRDAVKDLRF